MDTAPNSTSICRAISNTLLPMAGLSCGRMAEKGLQAAFAQGQADFFVRQADAFECRLDGQVGERKRGQAHNHHCPQKPSTRKVRLIQVEQLTNAGMHKGRVIAV